MRKDVAEIFKGKSPAQLALIETEIRRKIKSGAEGVDIGKYFRNVKFTCSMHCRLQRMAHYA